MIFRLHLLILPILIWSNSLIFSVAVYLLLFGFSGDPFLELTPLHPNGKIKFSKDSSGNFDSTLEVIFINIYARIFLLKSVSAALNFSSDSWALKFFVAKATH